MKNALPQPSTRPVAIWIMTGVAMFIIQIALGGITRLTGSGLSITEWKPIMGALPPLSEGQWLEKFHLYQQTPQYRLLNYDFNLSDFKFIFFWEWFHRLWARLIAVAFAIPFVIFLIQRRLRRSMVRPLVLLFLIGALQGAVGWIMVASGLTGDAIYVEPTRLALHFILACLLISYAFWFGLHLSVPEGQQLFHPRLSRLAGALIVLLIVQLIFGALMAGNKAATAAPTWPDINGSYAPSGMFREGWLSLIENKLAIHFIHRSLAYVLFILVGIWTMRAKRVDGTKWFAVWRWLPLLFVTLQVVLGISTVLTSADRRAGRWNTFEWLAQGHQLVAILLLLSLLGALFLTSKKWAMKSATAVERPAI